MYWHQGWDSAPAIVKHCAGAWQKHNPTWDIDLLDATTIGDKVKLPKTLETLSLPLPALSDIIRICLLKKYGGVWADATLWCARPLDDWIEAVCRNSGFFAYDKPGPDRPISSWFLAAKKQSRIIDLWHSSVCRLLAKTQAHHRFKWILDNRGKNRLFKLLGYLCMSYLAQRYREDDLLVAWSDDPEDGNYFWFHYLFRRLLEEDREFHQLWAATPKISADGPQLLRREGLMKPATKRTDDLIKNNVANMHKLTRRLTFPENISGTVLDSLYRSADG